jgi:scyllo-inositol 2-dehydrogenase (NADP+)
MGKLRICIIGAGNISNTRHIPGILKNTEAEIIGVISDEQKKIDRTLKQYPFIPNNFLIDVTNNIEEQLKKCNWFMTKVDAVIIGVPPKQHFLMTKAALILNKHTLVEKPMMMSEEECNEVISIAKQNNLILNVMHSFQYSDGMAKLYNRYKSGEFGELQSILELQLTNRKRRLPVWYNELPLGLYYDEAAHFFYGARRFGGELKVLNAHAQFNGNNDNTPKFLQVQLKAGEIPVQMYMNFNSPICEWGILLICEEKIAIYDYFKDILIVLNNDNQHLAKDVLKNSIQFTLQFWLGFLRNGIKMIRKQLIYGHDKCINIFINSIKSNNVNFELSPELGREVVIAMNEVIKHAKGEN